MDQHEGKLIFNTCVADFYEDLLDWGLRQGQSLRDRLVDDAWDWFYKEMKRENRLEEFYAIDDLAGDRYQTHIDLDGAYIDVSIWDEGAEDGEQTGG